jgi:hypothetical protein
LTIIEKRDNILLKREKMERGGKRHEKKIVESGFNGNDDNFGDSLFVWFVGLFE